MATQKNTFMETEHPLVHRIWKMLEEEIPPEFVEETSFVPSKTYQKSLAEATNLRRLGNNCYNESKLDDALMYYNQSVAYAPAGSEELALAYGNRSAVFENMKLFEPCLFDVNRALAGPILKLVRTRLLKRKKKAGKALQKYFTNRHTTREGGDDRTRPIRRMAVDDVDLVFYHSQIDDPIWNTEFHNAVLQNISSKIELKCDDRLGPQLVAKDDIMPGEALCTDELYSFSVFGSSRLNYCNYCDSRYGALIPCSYCPWEMYCSTECRNKAFHSYHRIDCQILPSWSNLHGVARGIRILLLRTFLRFTKQGSELTELMNSPVVREALDGKLDCATLQFSPENYPIFAHVVSRLRYSNYEATPCYQMMTGTVLAIFAALRSIHFFGNFDSRVQVSGNILNAHEYFGIMLLVYQISSMMPQFFPVQDYLVDSLVEPSRGRLEGVGYGFSLLTCFAHHSCDPNVRKILNRRHMLVYSVRSIKAGEQICPPGRAHFALRPLETRKEVHRDFGCPKCTCTACVENWPTLDELLQKGEKYLTDDETKIDRMERWRKWLSDNRSFSTSESILKSVIEFFRWARDCVEEPSAILLLCERYIERVMMSKGDMHLDAK